MRWINPILSSDLCGCIQDHGGLKISWGLTLFDSQTEIRKPSSGSRTPLTSWRVPAFFQHNVSSFTWQLTEASTSFVYNEQKLVVNIRCQLSEWDISPVHSNAHPTAHYDGLTGPQLSSLASGRNYIQSDEQKSVRWSKIDIIRELQRRGLMKGSTRWSCALRWSVLRGDWLAEFACACSYDPLYWNAGPGHSAAHSFNFCKQTNSSRLEDHTVDPGQLQPSAATIEWLPLLWKTFCFPVVTDLHIWRSQWVINIINLLLLSNAKSV